MRRKPSDCVAGIWFSPRQRANGLRSRQTSTKCGFASEEKSTNDNVTNQEIATIQTLVEKIKRKKEVGINYMKSWEMEEEARKRGYAAGREDGYSDGHEAGFNDGFNDGFSDGFNDGFSDGKEKVNQLTLLLAKAGRTDDIIRAAADKDYQNQLLKEFALLD